MSDRANLYGNTPTRSPESNPLNNRNNIGHPHLMQKHVPRTSVQRLDLVLGIVFGTCCIQQA
ncbi:hypothetical protein P692DRAFT_20838447 [Suillus brevipes Sb2]|nr:hypothetical protein P692DRAFT_20838447 [Suillus brevipes Sb2]